MPTNTFPAYSQGGQAGTANRTLLNDLNILDRSFEKNLVRKYGAENYAIVQMALGNVVTEEATENRDFYHYEKAPLHSAVKVQTAVTAPDAGASVTVTLAAESHTSSGTKSPIRVGEVVRIMTSGIEGQITAVNKSTPNAHTATIAPLKAAQAFTSAGSANLVANDYLLLRGAVNVGAGSDKLEGMSPILNKITNTTTEHRDDFTIDDRGHIEKNEVDFGGGNFGYYYLAQDDMNRRYLNNAWFKLLEGVAVDNIAGTVGTTGVIPRVAAGGSTIQYTAGSGAMTDLQALTRALNFYGGSGEYHWLQDIYQRQEFTKLLFTTYGQGAVNYGSVGANQELAVSYGFQSINVDGFTLHSYLNNGFSPESVYKINPGALTPEKKNFGLLIPQKLNLDPKTGKNLPSFQILFQKVNGQRVLTTETGMLAEGNKTTKAEKTISMLSYPGARVFGANQFAIIQGV